MLRVYSILYMEKLWNHSLCSDLKQLDHSEASSILSEVREVIAANAADTAGTAGTAIPTNNDYGAVSREIIKIDQEEVQVEEVIPKIEQEPLEEEQPVEYTLEEIEVDTGVLNDIDEEDEEEITDSSSSSSSEEEDKESVKEAQTEQAVNSLAIDTKRTQTEEEEEEEEDFSATAAVDHPTSLSSSSSIVPPLTPSSIHSVHNHSDFTDYQKRPRTTSLIRRETTKFNDRRKSLTKKLKRALTVKTENKRNSV